MVHAKSAGLIMTDQQTLAELVEQVRECLDPITRLVRYPLQATDEQTRGYWFTRFHDTLDQIKKLDP